MSSSSSRRRASAVLVLAVVTLLGVGLPIGTSPASAAPATKYTICHRTNAIKNPYRRISVAWGGTGGHEGHEPNVVFDLVDPVAVHGTSVNRDLQLGGGNDRWGDIFYASRSSGNGAGNVNARN